MDDKKHQDHQPQQGSKRIPGQPGQGQDKGQQPRQGEDDMLKPGKHHHDEHADQTDRGERSGAKLDQT